LKLFDVREDERGFDVVADSAWAGGDPLECSPAAGEQGEASPRQRVERSRVVGEVVGGEDVTVAGLFDWRVDALAGARTRPWRLTSGFRPRPRTR